MTSTSVALFSVSVISTHTLTWSVTCHAIIRGGHVRNFNSHAHVERDYPQHKSPDDSQISTHTLTWSVTFDADDCSAILKISTHTLTWSVTYTMMPKFTIIRHFNSHAHVERDTNYSCLDCKHLNFNSHAHVERD